MINKIHFTILAFLFILCIVFGFLYFSKHNEIQTKDDLYTKIREQGNPYLTVQVKLSDKYNSVSSLSADEQNNLSKTEDLKSIGIEILKTYNNPEKIIVPKRINVFVMPQDTLELGETMNLILTNTSIDSKSVNLNVVCGINTSRHIANFYLKSQSY